MAQSFYFGSAAQQLFGVYHTASKPFSRNAVVLCGTLGQEQMRAHRSFRRLAMMLSAEGFHVLRFDYLGTGDSAGDSDSISLETCQANIVSAIEELKAMSSATRISLIGLRLGAVLAVRAAASRKDVRHLVLWDPVSDGEAFLDDMSTTHKEMLVDPNRFPAPRDPGDAAPGELNGYPLNSLLRSEIAGITPPEFLASLPAQTSIVESSNVAKTSAETPAWPEPCHYTSIPEAYSWRRGGEVEIAFMPVDLLNALAARVSA